MDTQLLNRKYYWDGKIEDSPWTNKANDATPYGSSLAVAVANHLILKKDIRYQHRDYCGVGFCYRPFPGTGTFYYDCVSDGGFAFEDPYPGEELLPPLAKFFSCESFIDWLAAQSDESLCGREIPNGFFVNNQRITRTRLLEALAET